MKKILAVITASSILLSSCATIFGDNNKTVHVKSQPADAQVLVNNMSVGTTPIDITVPNTWSPTLLTFKKKGYINQTTQVNTTFQPVGILNIFFWPGFVIDAISGDMMKISPESRNISVNLIKA